ncbi:MAG: ABC transporter ATP-binding protein [Alphaproteobacteria bacterium]|nr:ABC transporter ATP-binding protein [Alphaproteobacteria bacterium]OJV14236.1 MAG: hypothetical protein BGO27_01905 [Alphaproteobacteria bacterium 33-17]
MAKSNLLTFKKYYLGLILKFKWYFIIMQVAMFGWAVQESLSPYFTMRILDILTDPNVDKSNVFQKHQTFFYISLLIYFLIEVGHRGHEYIAGKFYPKLKRHVRVSIMEYTVGHSHEFFIENYSGSISNKIARLADGIQDISEKIICVFVPVLISLVITCIYLFNTSKFLGYGIITWFVCYMGLFIICAKKSQNLAELHSQQVTLLNGKIVDILTNMFTVRLFSRKAYELERLSHENLREMKAYRKSALFNFKLNTALTLITIAFIVYMVAGGIMLWQHDYITLPEVVLSISSLYIIGMVWYMGFNLIPFYTQLGVCNEALDLLREKHQVEDINTPKPLHITDGKIEFANVTFEYANNKNVLKNCNLIIPANQKVGLVGLSGSGKTTFCSLIIRLFDITSGKITIDGIDIKNVSQDDLRENIAYIPQDLAMFHRSIMENIRYGRLSATDEEVVEAAKISKAHDFIISLPDGYDTMVGERGSKLSGGQRQRIAIARAILKNSKIIIMDEATSALDLITEHEIQKNLYKGIHDKTLIVIAHRISTLTDMDRILVFRHGEVIEDGTHTELLNHKGHYYDLWYKQSQAE